MLYPTLDQPQTAAFARQAEVGDDAASLRVYVVVAILVVIGLALVALAVWLIRQTRPDRQLLAPLERMEQRRWRGLDPQDRRRSLDEVRPDGATPIGRAQQEPTVDLDFASARPVRDFSDLVDRDADLASGTTAVALDGDTENPDTENPDTENPDTENPDTENPDTENPDTENPDTENPDTVLVNADTTGETLAIASDIDEVEDPLVIDTVLADPSVLSPSGSVGRDDSNTTVRSEQQRGPNGSTPAEAVVTHRSADETAPIGRSDISTTTSDEDDTGEHPSDASIDVPLMPGEGLLRRPRTDADQG